MREGDGGSSSKRNKKVSLEMYNFRGQCIKNYRRERESLKRS